MSRELTTSELRLIYLGRELKALGPHAENETVSAHLGRVGHMLTCLGESVAFDDFTEMDLALISAVAEESKSGVEV